MDNDDNVEATSQIRQPMKSEQAPEPSIMAEVLMRIDVSQPVRAVLADHLSEYTERGVYLGSFATSDPIKLIGGASVTLSGKVYVMDGSARLHDVTARLHEFGEHAVRLSAEAEDLLLARMYVHYDGGEYAPLLAAVAAAWPAD